MHVSPKQMFRALRHPNYRRWAVADFVSVTGTWMQNLGLNWFVLTKTGSPGLLGLSLLFQTLPGVVLSGWAGSIADRWPARRVLLVTQGLHGVLALFLAVGAWFDAPVSTFYALALLGGVVSVFDGPALGRFSAQLVSRDDLSNALGIGSVLSSGGRILGMGIAGALVAATGVPVLFLINALSFSAVLLAILRVRQSDGIFPLAKSSAAREGVRAGARYVLSHRPLIVMFLLSFVLSALGRNYQVTMAAMSEGQLNAGAVGYSTLSMVFAAGTVVGGFVAASFKQLTLRLVLVMALGTSLLQIASGTTASLWSFALTLFPIAVGAVVLDTATSTRIQLDTDEDMRGRVLAAKAMVTAASGAVGGPVLGWLSEVSGAGRALEVAGIITVLATAAAWLAFAKLKERRAMPADQRWAQLAPVQLQPADTAKPVSVPVREKRATSAARETGRNARPPRGPAWSRPARRLTGRAARKPVAESADKPQPT